MYTYNLNYSIAVDWPAVVEGHNICSDARKIYLHLLAVQVQAPKKFQNPVLNTFKYIYPIKKLKY